MLENRGQPESIPKIMASGGCYNARDMTNHDGWEVERFTSVHQIYEALVHCICLVSPLTSRYNIFNDEPKEQLMEWQHITLFYCHRVFQRWLLT